MRPYSDKMKFERTIFCNYGNLVFLFLFFAFACIPISAKSTAEDTLHLWVMPNGPGSQDAIRNGLNRFTAETRIPVHLEIIDWSEAFARISQALETGNGPDVVQLGSTWVSFFANKGYLANLSPILNRVDSSRFIPESWRATHVYGKKGTYSLPWFLDVRALFANRIVTDSLGIQAEDIQTEAQFLGILHYLANLQWVRKSGYPLVPFGLPGKGDWTGHQQLASFIWTAGGDYVRETKKGWRSALLDSATLRGISRYVSILRDSTYSPYSLRENSAQVVNRFTNGEQAFLLGTSEIIRKMDLPPSEQGLSESPIGKDGLTLFNIPRGPAGSIPFIGGSHLAIPKSSESNRNARKLLLFFVRADNINQYSHRIGFLPPDRSVMSVWAHDKRYQNLLKSIENGRSFPNIPEWAHIENLLITMTNDIGALYRLSWNTGANLNLELAKIILKNHNKINEYLHIQESPEMSISSIVSILEEPIPEKVFTPRKAKKKIIPIDGDDSKSNTFTWFLLLFIFVSCIFIVITERRLHLIQSLSRTTLYANLIRLRQKRK